jgi:hypothetical protein
MTFEHATDALPRHAFDRLALASSSAKLADHRSGIRVRFDR